MTQLRSNVLLAVLGILAAAVQLISARWRLSGDLAGGFLSGLIILGGMRALALEIEHIYLPPLVAVGASLLGLALGIAGSSVAYPRVFFIAPLLAALPTGALALKNGLRGARCQLCRARLRRLLSFSCPRCHLIACENCWEFERGRCRLCETNQAPLFPLDFSWWQQRFGSQTPSGRCALCLRIADGKVAHWPCAGCGHSQCRSCWDDNNGQCSRCGWTIPGLPTAVSEFVEAGARRVKG